MSSTSLDIQSSRDIETGWNVYTLTVEDTSVRVVPDAGCNVASINVGGEEFLLQPPTLIEQRGTKFGTPVLYPTPNRVRDGHFTFEGKDYRFTPNKGPNFIHGLVHSVPWTVLEARELIDRRGNTEPACELECELPFLPGTPRYELFPHPHILRLVIRVSAHQVRMTYTVDNSAGTTRIPFGFGIHTYFRYLGPRSTTFLTLPASYWMEAIECMPTGRLVDVGTTPLDLRTARSLEGFFADDVFFGIDPSKPILIEHREAGATLSIRVSEDFTHAVVFSPDGKPAFCVENQTCSTDAHNLYANELTRAAHLQIVDPGDTHSGHVEYQIHVNK